MRSDTTDPYIKLQGEVKHSALVKVEKVVDSFERKVSASSSVVERFLWKRVLESRRKLMQDILLLREPPKSNDQRAPLDLDGDIEKHRKSPCGRPHGLSKGVA